MLSNSPTYEKSIRAAAAEIDAPDASVLITGASGLIGSCMTDVLLAANRFHHKRFAVFAMGRSEKKLRQLFGTFPEVRCIAHDIREPISIDGVDCIIHAASNADPKRYALYPAETMLTSLLGTKNVLELGKTEHARVLFTSSFEVYGKLDQDEYAEDDCGLLDLNLLRNCYPESKRAAEYLCRAYAAEYETDCLIARLPSVYGPTMRLDDSKAHAQFLRNGLAGENIVLHSPGTQKRSYCYVLDVVRGLLHLLFHGKTGEIYNVANDQSIVTIAEVARMIADLTGTSVVFDLQNNLAQKGYSKPQNCVLKTDKIRALGWSGRYNLEEGLRETLAVLRETR